MSRRGCRLPAHASGFDPTAPQSAAVLTAGEGRRRATEAAAPPPTPSAALGGTAGVALDGRGCLQLVRRALELRAPRVVSGRFHIFCGRFGWDLPTCSACSCQSEITERKRPGQAAATLGAARDSGLPRPELRRLAATAEREFARARVAAPEVSSLAAAWRRRSGGGTSGASSQQLNRRDADADAEVAADAEVTAGRSARRRVRSRARRRERAAKRLSAAAAVSID
jgi:hypothetical protein